MSSASHHTPHQPKGKTLGLLIIGAIGVVYGDIGTSPLYALRESFNPEIGLPLNADNILGVLSLLIWALILIVSIKYVMFIMRADNKGEGGILVLMALAKRATQKRSSLVTAMGLFGAALFYGDGVITPAISVVSAVEGLKIATPALEPYIVPIALIILVMLFGIQSNGTGLIGRFFGPITIVYFATIAGLGLNQIIINPSVLAAFSPHYAFMIFTHNHWIGFLLLGSIVLAVTGAEALYADMGHFGRLPIRLAWIYFVMPCLMLNYLGQGALILRAPDTIQNPFYLLAPEWMLYPLVALATMATVIASQAMISGAFSVTQQAIQLGFLPRLKIVHTSSKHIGQIYMPHLNIALFIGVILFVLWFRTSTNMAAAYGIAVTGTMLLTTGLAYVVARYKWNLSRFKALLLVVPFIIIDGALFSSALMKLSHGIGAWVPLLLGIGLFIVMLTWNQGRDLIRQYTHNSTEKLTAFIDHLDFKNLKIAPGFAVFLVRNADRVPYALAMNIKHNKVVHDTTIIVTVEAADMPRVSEAERLSVDRLSPHFIRATITYGFMQEPHVPRALSHLKDFGITNDLRDAVYFISRERVVPSASKKGMWVWRERLYALMQRNAADASRFFHLPDGRIIEIGTPVKI